MKGFGQKKIKKKNDIHSLIKKKLFNEAQIYQNNGDLDLAARCYENIIKKGLEDAKSLSNYGIILFQQGYIDKSINLFKKSIESYPYESDLYINLSNIFKLNNELINAEILIRKAIEINSDSIIALNNLVSILIIKKNFFEAERFCLSSLKINPNNHCALYNLGLIYINLNRLNDSITLFRKAIEYETEDFSSNLNLGVALLKKDEFEESKKYNQIALKLNNSSFEPLFNLGQIALFTNDFKSAVKYFKRSLPNQTNNYKIHRYLGIAQFLCNEEESLENLDKSILLSPKTNLSKVLFEVIKLKIKNQKSKKVINQDYHDLRDTEPIILRREVETELLNYIYNKKTLDLNKFDDTTFRNARGTDYKLFEEDHEILNIIRFNLIQLIENHFKCKVYFRDSFFTILEGSGEVNKHNHLDNLDKVKKLDLYHHKFSLVYYLKTGNKDCSEPGYISFYNPHMKLLPEPGMIIIFPSERYHSVIYNGYEDRVIIGVNFYIF